MANTKKKKTQHKELAANYSFLLWDGLGFFGFSSNKLDRLTGKEVRWFDRFKNPIWLALNFTTIVIIMTFLAHQLNNIGGNLS